MNTSFWSKSTLYMNVNELARSLNITEDDFPINSETIARRYCYNVSIEQLPFPSNDICGILYKGKKSTSIALNAGRSNTMRNFDCMHELIHYFFHDIEDCQYICTADNSEESSIVQDAYIEWQANEGAAQFLVPYEILLPLIKEKRSFLYARGGALFLREFLAKKFNVTEDVIKIRLESLKFEIHQYLNGCSLDKIHILSAKKQSEKGIVIESLNSSPNGWSCDWQPATGYSFVSDEERDLLDDLKFGFNY